MLMARYSFRQALGGASAESPSSLSASLAAKKNARQKEPAQSFVFRGTASGQKAFISRAMGKSFAPEAFYKNMRAIAQAIKKNESTFVDSKGIEHPLEKITPSQRTMAIKWANQGKVVSREGLQKVGQGFVETARELDMKLQSGLNIGSAHEAAIKMGKKMTATKPTAMQERQERLKIVAGVLPPKPQPTGANAPAPAIKPNLAPTSMTFGAITPISSGAGSTHSLTPMPVGGRPPANFTTPGSGRGYSQSAIEPASIGSPTGNGVDDVTPQPAPPTDTSEPEAPAVPVFQDPDPLDEPVPAHPGVPSEPTTADAPAGDTEDEQ